MNVTPSQFPHGKAEERAREMPVGPVLLAGAIGSGAVIVLSVIGLAGLFSATQAAVGTIVAGFANVNLGWLNAWRHHRSHFPNAVSGRDLMCRAALTPGLQGGLAGMVLGVLALLGVVPGVLTAAAVVTLGTALVLDGIGILESYWFAGIHAADSSCREARLRWVFFGSGGQVLSGLGAMALGILAVIGLAPGILVLVGLICLGTAGLVASAVRRCWLKDNKGDSAPAG